MLKTSQTCFFHVPDTSGKFRKKNFFESFWPSKKNFSKIFEVQIFQDFTCQTTKREALDLQASLENFLETLHPSCGYVKHSPGSGLSNARCLVSPRHTQMKRHPIFWFTVKNVGLRHLFNFTCLDEKQMKKLNKKQKLTFHDY